MSNHLERPLGLDRGKKRQGGALSKGKFFAGLSSILVLGAAGWFAFDRMPFQITKAPVKPVAAAPAEPVPEQKPVVTETASVAEPGDEAISPPLPAGGAKIIRVNPDNAATPGVTVRDPGKVIQEARVAHIPEPDLIEQGAAGQLPKRAADGRRPFDVYQRSWSGTRGARVAIVIGGMGVSQTSTQAAIDTLPPEITLAFAPQGNSLSRWAQAARKKGHEILLQVPMEPFDYPRVDPGRGTLIVEAAPEANLKVLQDSMGRLTNYVGVVNYLGARFTAEEAALDPVMQELGKRGLMYLDDGTSARSQADSLSQRGGAPFAASDLTIDGVQDKADILKSLDQLEATARAKGSAIAMGTGFDVTVEAVTEWAKGAKKRGIEIVGVASLARDTGQ
ncbi:MAG: divergent polysaccharide deacetylase family protein [Rhizobiaceae bacterium]